MRQFWSDRKGNVALVFALAMIPIFGAVGAALDYSMASAYRADMQKALDATALALTKIMPTDEATLNTVGNKYFQANLGNPTLSDLQLTITPDIGILKLSAKATYKAQMANLIGASTIELGTRAEAKWSIGKVEVALVLDNSGSMGSLDRMTQLKAASHNLLDVLENAAKQPDDAKVAIIPFDSVVNVGTAYINADWIKWAAWEAANGTCSKSQYKKQSSCTSNGGTWTPSDHSAWHGCVWDRDKDNDTLDREPTTSDATKYPAVQCDNTINSSLLVSMMPITNTWTALHDKVTSMTIAGYTNITIGLVWGWHALSPSPVMTEGVPYNTENLTKYVVLLTDGDNTKNAHGDSKSTMNTRTTATCDNIKATGIKIYTVRLIEGNATLLQNCASDPSMYYDVQNASELSSVFSAIGAEIANLHLSK